MAERRMFSKSIIDSDNFLDMPLSTQALYFHLSMRADDDGFINNPKKIMRMVGSSEDELKVLFAKQYVLGFETGIIVIKHWKLHNYIKKDRYHETIHTEEKQLLTTKENKEYGYKMDTERIQDGYPGKVSIGKVSQDKYRVEKEKKKSKRFIKPTVEHIEEYMNSRQQRHNFTADKFFNYYESKGWMIGKNKMKDWKAAIRTWEGNDTKNQKIDTYNVCEIEGF